MTARRLGEARRGHCLTAAQTGSDWAQSISIHGRRLARIYYIRLTGHVRTVATAELRRELVKWSFAFDEPNIMRATGGVDFPY
jgi:hypothetical protein